MDNEKIVENWASLQEMLFSNSSVAPGGSHQFEMIFRGLADKDYELLSSLNRNCKDRLDLENNLLRNFKKYIHAQNDSKSLWRLIALAQHHGLPTRLLDWTFSPYVALYFATEDLNKYHLDGAVWCLNLVKMNQLLPLAIVKKLHKEQANVFTAEMLDVYFPDLETLRTLKNFKKYAGAHKESYFLFFEPPSMNERIINQYSLFSVPSRPDLILSEWLISHPELYVKIIIPKALKPDIKCRLDQINITERIIYPGLDGICKWLSRYYMPSKEPGS